MKNKVCNQGNIHLVGIPTKYQTKVSNYVLEGLDSATSILKYTKNIDVVIFRAEAWEVHPKMSVSAFTLGRSQRIDFKINFARKNIIDIITTELPLTLHHEVAHVVRESTVGYSKTLLDYFIDEGVGCFVEQCMMQNRKIPYIQKIDNEQEFWKKAQKIIFKKTNWNDSREWFFGTGSLPNWIGYRLGYLIVQKYMSNPTIGMDKLVRMSSMEILKKSGMMLL